MNQKTIKLILLAILLTFIFPWIVGYNVAMYGYNSTGLDSVSDKISSDVISDTYFKAKIDKYFDLPLNELDSDLNLITTAVFVTSEKGNFIAIFEKEFNGKPEEFNDQIKAYEDILREGETLVFKLKESDFLNGITEGLIRDMLRTSDLYSDSLPIAYYSGLEEIKSNNMAIYGGVSTTLSFLTGVIIFILIYRRFFKKKERGVKEYKLTMQYQIKFSYF